MTELSFLGELSLSTAHVRHDRLLYLCDSLHLLEDLPETSPLWSQPCLWCLSLWPTSTKKKNVISINLFKDSKGQANRKKSQLSNHNLLQLYSAFLGTQSTLHNKGGGESPHPPPVYSIHLDDATAAIFAPERPPHTSLLVERRKWESQSVFGDD